MDAVELEALAPITIALLALFVSVLNLYLTQMRSASLSIVAGELVNIHHFTEGNCGISVPVSITNTGARAATIRRLGLLVQVDRSIDGYLLEPFNYEKVNEDGHMKISSLSTPITVAGRGTETCQVLFRSSLSNPTEFQLVSAGEYRFTLLVWLKASPEPQAANAFKVVLSSEDSQVLKDCIREKRSTYRQLRQSTWSNWSARKLTATEVRALSTPHAA
jgi:hypothetical protein